MSNTKAGESGIEGSVAIGKHTAESMTRKPRAPTPFAVSICLKDAVTEREITTVQSTADGHFRIALPPGDYLLEPLSPRPFVPPYAEAQRVTVQAGQFTTVTIVYESGVR